MLTEACRLTQDKQRDLMEQGSFGQVVEGLDRGWTGGCTEAGLGHFGACSFGSEHSGRKAKICWVRGSC